MPTPSPGPGTILPHSVAKVTDQIDFKPDDQMDGKVLVVTVTLSGSFPASTAAATKRLRGSSRVDADKVVLASNTYHFGVARQQQYGVLRQMLDTSVTTSLALLVDPLKTPNGWPVVHVRNLGNPTKAMALFVRISLHHHKGSAPIPYVSFSDNYLTLAAGSPATKVFMSPMNRGIQHSDAGVVCVSAWNADLVCKPLLTAEKIANSSA
jgi:hypothetical protein